MRNYERGRHFRPQAKPILGIPHDRLAALRAVAKNSTRPPQRLLDRLEGEGLLHVAKNGRVTLTDLGRAEVAFYNQYPTKVRC